MLFAVEKKSSECENIFQIINVAFVINSDQRAKAIKQKNLTMQICHEPSVSDD